MTPGSREEKFAAFGRRAFDTNRAAVGQHDFPRDTQPEPGPFVAARFRDAKKFIEDTPMKVRGNAGPLVLDRKSNTCAPSFFALSVIVPSDGECLTAFEISWKKPVDSRTADGDGGKIRFDRHLQMKTARRDQFPLTVGDILNQLLAGKDFFRSGRRRLQTGEIEKILDHFKQAVGIRARRQKAVRSVWD